MIFINNIHLPAVMNKYFLLLALLLIVPFAYSLDYGTNDPYFIVRVQDILEDGTYSDLLRLRDSSNIFLLPDIRSINDFILLRRDFRDIDHSFHRLRNFDYDPYLHARANTIPRYGYPRAYRYSYGYRDYYPYEVSYNDYGVVRYCSRTSCVWI